MDDILEKLTYKAINGEKITKEEAIKLVGVPVSDLSKSANEIRKHYHGNKFDICTIVNGKSGNCSENCKFCAQSAHSKTAIVTHPLLSEEELVRTAKISHDQGVLRFSIVTSGKRLSKNEVDKMCDAIKRIKDEVGISVCVSFGLLDESDFKKLKDAGVTRVHNNLEASPNFFKKVCTTHTTQDKITAIKAAQNVGLEVCSGGIIGLGESMEDRIDMALLLRELGVKSVPINILNPIKGTPFENNPPLSQEEILRTVAIFRFILPNTFIRLAGGRGLLRDKGESCFLSGANSAISGDMLTTSGITVATDMELLKKLNFEVKF